MLFFGVSAFLLCFITDCVSLATSSFYIGCALGWGNGKGWGGGAKLQRSPCPAVGLRLPGR